MDYLTQVAKLAAIVPAWILLIMTDKHLLGLPVLEGSLWHSPRIPPRLTSRARRGYEHASPSNFGRHSACSCDDSVNCSAGQHERGSGSFVISNAHPSQEPIAIPRSSPVLASGTTALSLYQPLEVHDPFPTSSRWLEPGYVMSFVIFVLVLAFLRIITNCHRKSVGNSQITQARNACDFERPFPDPFDPQQLIQTTSTDFANSFTSASKHRRDHKDSCKTPEKSEFVEDKGTRADAITEKEKLEERNIGSNKNGSEAGEEDSKEDSRREWNGAMYENGLGDSGHIPENENLNGPPARGEGKVQKYGMRQKAKKKIAKRALAEKATQNAGEAANNFREDVEDREEEGSATRIGVWAESSREDTKANEDERRKGEEVVKGPEISREDIQEREEELPCVEPEAKKKKKRRRRARNHEVTGHALTDNNHGPDDQTEILPHQHHA